MFAGTELALVGVPIVRGRVQALLLVGVEQLLLVVHTHGSSHDLTDVGHQDVDGLGELGVVLATLHVESFDVLGELVQHDRLVDLVRHKAFGSLGYVLADLVISAIFLLVVVVFQPLNGLDIFYSSERFPYRKNRENEQIITNFV